MAQPASLRDLIHHYFTRAEIRGLCLDLGIEYEDLPGETRIEEAQSLVERCLRHGRLPELVQRCRALRPQPVWPDAEAVSAEWEKIRKGIDAQENLRGILSDEQIRQTLEALHQRESTLLTRLIGTGAIAQGEGAKALGQAAVDASDADVAGSIVSGDNNHIEHIVHIYQDGGGQLPVETLRRALDDYASWMVTTYGRIPLRGLSDREYHLPDPDLPDVYVSLRAQREASRHRRAPETEPDVIDMGSLLQQGTRLVITGGPGSGKTTFLRHIAYLLAQAIHTGRETAVRQQLNLEGSLPLPIYLSLGDFYRYRQENNSGTLIDFISYTLIQQHGVYDLPKDFFAQMLSQEKTICLLLDSLDEIPSEDGRFQVSNAVLQLAANRSIGQILVASRDHAYAGRVMLRRPFRRFLVQPMNQEQIEALSRRWCHAVYLPDQAAVETKALKAEINALEAIRRQQGEAPLVDSPLMVTIVAIVHYNERKLPQQRAALYEKCVNALLAEQHKGEEGQGQSQLFLEKRGGSTDAKRGHLALLAYEMMCSREDAAAGRTATEAQVVNWLLPSFSQTEGTAAAQPKIAAFCRAMCDRASILHERGGLYEFTHLTFQEFLCAYHLVVNETPGAIGDIFREEGRVQQSWWRETVLLTVGYLGKTSATQSLKLAQALLETFSTDAAGLAAAELATSGLLELEVPAPALRQQARDRLVALLTDDTLLGTPAERAQAGRTLSRLGDNRPGVGVDRETGLPDIVWSKIEIPAGTYTIGGDKYAWGGFGKREVEIPRPYRLARYPITNAQFQAFLDAPDRDDPAWWRDMPKDARQFRESQWHYANHPRETVSWHQIMAFCRWLTAKLHAGLLPAGPLAGDVGRYVITLPHEYEWEVAARWPNEDVQQRVYPWGSEWDEAKANTDEGGIGQTTAVGMYPTGRNVTLDLYDLSGNVWEYCRNQYGKPDADMDPNNVDMSSSRCVLRGGSWDNDRYYARVSFRVGYAPDGRDLGVGFRVVVVRRSPSHPDHVRRETGAYIAS